MMRTALVVLCLVASGCALRHRGGAEPPPGARLDANTVAVFVHTEPGLTRVPVGDQVRRERVVDELTSLLEGKNRLAVVPFRADADVVVEVLSGPMVFKPRDPDARFDPHALLVDVSAAGQTSRLTESGAREDRTVRALAKAIDRWIKANASSILSARRPAK